MSAGSEIRHAHETVPAEVLEAIRDDSLFAIVGHAEPDGDCIGSQLALAHFLKRLGKEVVLLSPGPFLRPEIRAFEPQFIATPDPALAAREPTVFVLDCSSPERIGDFAPVFEGLDIIVVDHHSAGKSFGAVRYIDSSAPAVTLLIQRIIEQSGHEIDPVEARLLLFGLCTDTGFFRHLDANDPSVYEAIARMNRAGATPKEIYQMIYAGRPIASRILLGKVLSRTTQHFGGRVLLTYETLEDRREYGVENRDSDTLYQLLQSTALCEVVVFVREEETDECSIGLRATGSVDVGAVAQAFHGGGHRKAAGFRWTGTRREIEQRLLAVFEQRFT